VDNICIVLEYARDCFLRAPQLTTASHGHKPAITIHLKERALIVCHVFVFHGGLDEQVYFGEKRCCQFRIFISQVLAPSTTNKINHFPAFICLIADKRSYFTE
jgi:hypothetical protein